MENIEKTFKSIRHLINNTVKTISPSNSIFEAAQRMQLEEIGTLIVVDEENRPIGIITDRDITVSVVADGRDPQETIVEEIMTSELIVANENLGIFDLIKLFSKYSVRRIPVIKRDRLVGIVSVDDIIVVVATELSNIAMTLSSNSKMV